MEDKTPSRPFSVRLGPTEPFSLIISMLTELQSQVDTLGALVCELHSRAESDPDVDEPRFLDVVKRWQDLNAKLRLERVYALQREYPPDEQG